MTRDEMFHKLTLRHEELVCKYADKNVTDKQFFEELCCSIYAGDEFKEPEKKKKTIKLDNDCGFEYKGYTFKLTPCTMLSSKQQVIDTAGEFLCGGVRGIFTDRYVCWMYEHKDDDGYTKEECDEPDCWSSKVYLVPGAWAWGAEFDCNPGYEVDKIILDKIDEFLKLNPDL